MSEQSSAWKGACSVCACACARVCAHTHGCAVLINSISATGSYHLKALGFLYSNQRHPEAEIKGTV